VGCFLGGEGVAELAGGTEMQVVGEKVLAE